MSPTGGEPRDPFRTDGSSSPPPGTPSQPNKPPGQPTLASPEAKRTAIRLAVVSIAAVGSAFFAPPLGALLGVVAITIAIRSKHLVPARPRVVGIVSGSMAVVVGLVLSVALLLFQTELTEYVQCNRAANTVQAQQNCQDALNDSLASRLGL